VQLKMAGYKLTSTYFANSSTAVLIFSGY